METHERLDVWRIAIDLVDLVYDATARFPADERYGLSSQLRRASVSVPANIAEGAGRDSTRDYLRHISIARGSLAEVKTLLVIVSRRDYAASDTIRELRSKADTVGRLLTGLRNALKRKLNQPSD